MKISVIIPAHNEELYIANTLQAVCGQDYSDFEVIVVDNVSTDKTAQVAAKFPVTILHENRKGTQWALECGRNVAKGEIIARLDADCLPDRDWLTKGARLFSNPRVMAVSGPYDYYDGSQVFRYFFLFVQKIIYYSVNILCRILHIGGLLVGGNSFMRASGLHTINGFDTSIQFYGDDTDVAKRMSRIGRVIFNNSLILKSSARRLASQGIIKTLFIYVISFCNVIIKG